jgi:hypothetical protein
MQDFTLNPIKYGIVGLKYARIALKRLIPIMISVSNWQFKTFGLNKSITYPQHDDQH